MQLKRKDNIIKGHRLRDFTCSKTQYFARNTMGYILLLKQKQFLYIGAVKIKSMVSKV